MFFILFIYEQYSTHLQTDKSNLMHIKRIFWIFFISFIGTLSWGQDLHHTNYRYTPLYLNPAQAGNFYGTIRFGGSYRQQGEKLLLKGYKTPQLFADMPINFAFRKEDWIGVGIHAYSDVSGDIPISTSGMLINLAYHLSLDLKQTSIISIGVQYGMTQKKIDNIDKIILGSKYINTGGPKIDLDKLQDYKSSFADINIGITYKKKLKDGQSFIVGLGVFHILKPTYKGIVRNNYLDRRITIHSNYHFRYNDRIYMQPQIIASLSGNAYDITPQFKAFYKLKKDTRSKKYNDNVYFGLGYRVADALEIMIGTHYKDYDIGISYDLTVSSAAIYNDHQGGIEIGLFKILKISKKPKVKPVIFCPRL